MTDENQTPGIAPGSFHLTSARKDSGKSMFGLPPSQANKVYGNVAVPGEHRGMPVAFRNPYLTALDMAVSFLAMYELCADESKPPLLTEVMRADIEWIRMVADHSNNPPPPEAPRYDQTTSEVFRLPFTIGRENGQMMAHWHEPSFATIHGNPHPIGPVATQLYSRLMGQREKGMLIKEVRLFLRALADEFMALRVQAEELSLITTEKAKKLKGMDDALRETLLELEFK